MDFREVFCFELNFLLLYNNIGFWYDIYNLRSFLYILMMFLKKEKKVLYYDISRYCFEKWWYNIIE